MKCFVLALFFIAAAGPPEAGIPYFSSTRQVHVTQPDRQNFFLVDAELWAHARPDLGDLRLFDGVNPVQYSISEQRAEVSSEEVTTKILNLGSVHGHTEFDIDANGLPEYDRIRLTLDAHDFVATAKISGGAVAGKATDVVLGSSTVYDFSKEALGGNSFLRLPVSNFRFLHVELSPGITPKQVLGAEIANLREQKAVWTKAGSCGAPQAKQRQTVIACIVPAGVPLSRIGFEVNPAQVNFRRSISVQDAKGMQLASGDISRVRVNRGGTLVDAEDLDVAVGSRTGPVTVIVDDGDNPPLNLTQVNALTLERRVYFDPHGKSELTLFYGDAQILAPVYDYDRFFHVEASPAEAQLGDATQNPQYTGRPDERPWSERHTGVLWAAMLLAVAGLSGLALRGLKSPDPP